ncbi:TetR/AcrR family transcriptional regulator [Pseudonocardia halophobica]|uniref:TetR family transcriptional regulator n=1 Tax=Pseudonocardia halophobica TaxID=29401 RepID=A0A9W6NWH9_9PSEU|nr:TetR/AcrR family transcriptional regulator [Pseudonocardia halophobica]GLL11457.1 TetR family transcriptional regulator [Pseudonocardia halophobica]
MVKAVNRPSGLRAEQAAQTKVRILEAAREVFERRGYGGARIEDIAAGAGVAVPTVYKTFTNKKTLLAGVVARAMTGADYAGDVDEQDWWKEQLREPDPARQLRLIARNARTIYGRAASVLEILRASAPLDPDIAATWADVFAQRLQRSHRTAHNLLAKAGRRARFDEQETAVTLLALTRPELYSEQIGLGRDPDQYERWLGDVLVTSLLTSGSDPQPLTGSA